jgi:hypothetical protein
MLKKIKEILKFFAGILPYLLIFILVVSILVVIYQQGLTFDHLIILINSLIWPTIVLVALLFFKKVFTYFFFSLEEFNFFGTRGTLKNVEEMIREKADELWRNEKGQKKLKTERLDHQKELAELKDSKIQQTERANRAIKLTEEVLVANEKIQKEYLQLNKLYSSLLNQAGPQQANSKVGSASIVRRIENLENISVTKIEEARDVGQTNSVEESSENKKT